MLASVLRSSYFNQIVLPQSDEVSNALSLGL